MRHRIIHRLAVIFIAMLGFAFGVINYNGDDYNEKLLPQTFGGANSIRYVVIGSNISLTANNTANGNTATFEINGVSYLGKGAVSVDESGDDRYHIYFVPKGNNSASITISGTNDWTTQVNTSIALPFSQSGIGSYFYVTMAEIDSLSSANMDFLLINNIDYTNHNMRIIPERKNGNYYIYYGGTNANAWLNLYWAPFLNVKVLLEGGL